MANWSKSGNVYTVDFHRCVMVDLPKAPVRKSVLLRTLADMSEPGSVERYVLERLAGAPGVDDV
jgi:hypothetical protein